MAKTSTMPHNVLLALEWYDYRFHRGVARVAAREGWHLTSPSGRPGFQPVPEDWRGTGAITLAGDVWLNRLRQRNVAVVDIGLTGSRQVPRTVVDNAAVAALAYAFLRERGWQSFIALGGWGKSRMLIERVDAFARLATAEGLACDQIQIEDLRPRLGQGRVAIFAAQDVLGAQAQAVARDLGLRVPEDIAILGVDNNDLVCEALPVPLASVDTDQEGLGVAAAERLARLLAGHHDEGALVRHPPRGVVARASAEAFGTDHPGLQAALALARQNPACGVRALALAAGLSPQGLDLAFHRDLGLAPGTFLRRQRLRVAEDALAAGASLEDAAARAGLATASGLCALMRRERGVTPAQWRTREQRGRPPASH